jgi:hypothetical protein
VAEDVNDASSMPMTDVGRTPYRGFSAGDGKPSPYLADVDLTDSGHGRTGGDAHRLADQHDGIGAIAARWSSADRREVARLP